MTDNSTDNFAQHKRQYNKVYKNKYFDYNIGSDTVKNQDFEYSQKFQPPEDVKQKEQEEEVKKDRAKKKQQEKKQKMLHKLLSGAASYAAMKRFQREEKAEEMAYNPDGTQGPTNGTQLGPDGVARPGCGNPEHDCTFAQKVISGYASDEADGLATRSGMSMKEREELKKEARKNAEDDYGDYYNEYYDDKSDSEGLNEYEDEEDEDEDESSDDGLTITRMF